MSLTIDEYNWTYLGCLWCRGRNEQQAIALLDGQPICATCVDRLVERWAAEEIAPSLRDVLPALDGS